MKDNGFALADILVSIAIAAGVIGATTVGLSVAMRSVRTTGEVKLTLVEAGSLAARLSAGMTPDQALTELPGWSLSFRDVSEDPNGAWKAYESTASKVGPRPFEFTTIIVRSRDEPIKAK